MARKIGIDTKQKLGITTTLINDNKSIRVEVCCLTSSITFLTFEMESSEFLLMLRGCANVHTTDAMTRGLDKIGLVQEHKILEFPMPEDTDIYGTNREELAIKEESQHIPEGWYSDHYYKSQGSFFKNKEDKPMARVCIRRWVKPETLKTE